MITRTEAHKELRQLKAAHPELCSDAVLMCRVLDMMETYRMVSEILLLMLHLVLNEC